MKVYTVIRRFSVDVARVISAENMAEAEQKAEVIKFDRYLKPAPGAEVYEWGGLSGTSITEERE